jgi:hypothetical protein
MGDLVGLELKKKKEQEKLDELRMKEQDT